MKKQILSLCIITAMFLSACTSYEGEEENDKELSTMVYYEQSSEDKSVFTSESDTMIYIKIPQLNSLEFDLSQYDLNDYVDTALEYGDQITVKVFYSSVLSEDVMECFVWTYALGENPIAVGLDELMIGMHYGDCLETTFHVSSDEEDTIFAYRAGDDVDFKIYINWVEKEDKKDELQEEIWNQLIAQCSISAIYEEYLDFFDTEETAKEATVAKAITQKWDLDEDSEEYEEALALYEQFQETNLDYEYDESIKFIIRKEAITQKILEYLCSK